MNYKYPEVTNNDNIADQWKMVQELCCILNNNDIFCDSSTVVPKVRYTINKLPSIVNTIHGTLGEDVTTEDLKKVLYNVQEYVASYNNKARERISDEDIKLVLYAYEEDYIQIFKDIYNTEKYLNRKRNMLKDVLDNGINYDLSNDDSMCRVIDTLSFFIYERQRILDTTKNYSGHINEYNVFCRCAGINLMDDGYINSTYNDYIFAKDRMMDIIDSLQDLYDAEPEIFSDGDKEIVCKCIIMFSNTLVSMMVSSSDVTDGRMEEDCVSEDFTKVMPYYEFITYSRDRSLLTLSFGTDELLRHSIHSLYPINTDILILTSYLLALTDYYFLMHTDQEEYDYSMKSFIEYNIYDEDFMTIFGMILLENNIDPSIYVTMMRFMYSDSIQKYSKEADEYVKYINEGTDTEDGDIDDMEEDEEINNDTDVWYSDTVTQVKYLIDTIMSLIDDKNHTLGYDKSSVKELIEKLEVVLAKQYDHDVSKDITHEEEYTVDQCMRNIVEYLCAIDDTIYKRNKYGTLCITIYSAIADIYGAADTTLKYLPCFIKHLMEYCCSRTLGSIAVNNELYYDYEVFEKFEDIDLICVLDGIDTDNLPASDKVFLIVGVLQYAILSMYADRCLGYDIHTILNRLDDRFPSDDTMTDILESIQKYIDDNGINIDDMPKVKTLISRVTKLVEVSSVKPSNTTKEDIKDDVETIESVTDSMMELFRSLIPSSMAEVSMFKALKDINTKLDKLVDLYDELYDGHIDYDDTYTKIAVDRVYDKYVDGSLWTNSDILAICESLITSIQDASTYKNEFEKYKHILPFTCELMEYAIVKSIVEYTEKNDCVHDVIGGLEYIESITNLDELDIMKFLNRVKDKGSESSLFIVTSILQFFRSIILLDKDTMTQSQIIKKINNRLYSDGGVSIEDVIEICYDIATSAKSTTYLSSAVYSLAKILDMYYTKGIYDNVIEDNVSEEDEDDTAYTESDLLKLLVHKDPEKWTLDDIKEITRIVIYLAGSDTNDDIRDFLLKFSRRNPYLNAANTHSRITAPAHKKVFSYIQESDIINRKFKDEEYALSEYREFITALKGLLYLSDASTVKFLRDTVTIIDLRNKYDIDNLLSVDTINVLDIIKDYTELCTSGNVDETMSFDIKTELNRFMAGILNIICYLANDISLAKEFSVEDTTYLLKLVDRVFGCTLTDALQVIEDCSNRCGLTEEYYRLPELINGVREGMDLNPALFKVDLTTYKVYVPMLDKEVDVMIDYADTVDKFVDLIIDFVDDTNIEDSVMMSRTMSFIDECKIFTDTSDVLFISDAEDARGLLMIVYAFLDNIMDDAIEAVMDNDFVDTLTDLKRSMKLIHNNIIAITE